MMAKRRMFAITIIDSDAFTDMPLSTQALYFHLSMRADDDGFLNNPKKIQRMIGSSDDDLKLLIAKRFILPFESGVVVIKHWKIHNYIAKDRYTPTVYKEEKAQLELKDNGSYTECIQNDDTGKVRLGKDRTGKVRLGEGSIDEETTSVIPSHKQIEEYVEEHSLKVDPERFYNYYTKTGWKTSAGNPIDWHEKLKEWNDSERDKPSQTTSDNPFINRLKKGAYDD